MEEAARLCDRIAIVDHGKVVANDTLSGLLRLAPVANFLVIDLANDAFQAINRLRELNNIKQAEQTNRQLRVGMEHIDDIPGILAWLQTNNASIEHIQTERPTLETVFLYLTGRTLRDA